jgi:hypothetical protein
MNTEDIWFNDISVLFEPSDMLSIVPTKYMSLGGKINAFTRFTLYLSLILTIVKQNYLYIYVFIIPVIIIYVVYIFSPQSKEFFKENDNSNETKQVTNVMTDIDLNKVMEEALLEECQQPTRDNPVMNVLPTDNFQQRKPACDINDKTISDKITKDIFDSYSEKLYNDTTAIYNSKAYERPFYTMPNNKVPNDQGTFAKWLYATPVSCASGNDGILKQTRACAYNNKSLHELSEELNAPTNNATAANNNLAV